MGQVVCYYVFFFFFALEFTKTQIFLRRGRIPFPPPWKNPVSVPVLNINTIFLFWKVHLCVFHLKRKIAKSLSNYQQLFFGPKQNQDGCVTIKPRCCESQIYHDPSKYLTREGAWEAHFTFFHGKSPHGVFYSKLYKTNTTSTLGCICSTIN